MNIENEASRLSQKAVTENHSRKRRSYLSKVPHISAALTAVLAALGAVDVNAQTQTDLLNTKGDFESATCPLQSPPDWNQIVNDPSFPPVYHCAGNPPPLVDFTGNSAVEVGYSANGTTFATNGLRYTASFSATPDQTITDQFAAAYETKEPGVTVKPQTKVTWKDAGGNVTGTDTFSPAHAKGPDQWEQFSRTYGPSGIAIPANTVSGTIEVGISGSGGTTTTGIKGLEYIDSVQVMGPIAASPTPTRVPGVGGVASQPDLENLPKTSVSHSSRNTMVEIGAGAAAATLTFVAGAYALSASRKKED